MPKEFDWKPISEEKPSTKVVARIKKEFGLSKTSAEVLVRRRITDKETIRKYLHGSYRDLYSPFLFKDMLIATERILKAARKRERVFIHGDYDVDGVMSCALIKIMFENLGSNNVRAFCPPRSLGYGLSVQAVELAFREHTKLLITTDCGSNEKKSLKLAKKYKMDVIVLDHHSFKKRPDVLAFINANAGDYPFDGLCGAGVVFKVMQAIDTQEKIQPENYIDMVALATIADSEPLLDENRILTKLGLRQLTRTTSTGLGALLKACGFFRKKISTEVAGFIICPKINAPGRMCSPKPSLDLMLTQDVGRAEHLAKKLVSINRKRIELNHKIRDEAIAQIEENYKNDRFFVLENNSWSKGIIGIVASTMVELYHKPCAIISNGYGSVRTVPEFSLLESLGKCSEYFIRWGGHPMAAGLHVKKGKTAAFRERINAVVQDILPENPRPYMLYDAKLKLRQVGMDLVKEMETLEPFGNGNPVPNFVLEDVQCARDRITKDGQHMQLSLSQKGSLVSAIGFWLAGHKEKIIDPAQRFDLLCLLERGKFDTEQVIVKDMKEVSLNW